MAKGSGRSSRPTTNSTAQPKPVSNRVLNKHPSLQQFPRSKGSGDVDVTFGVNIPFRSGGSPISPRSGSTAITKPSIASGGVPSSTNKYRRDGSSD